LLGITHIIRGKDLMIESEMEQYIWKIFSWQMPELLHAGMVRIEGMGAKISKSKAQKEIKSGEFFGWDDPRTWSIQSLRKRGFQAETLRKFVEDIGLNQNDISVPLEILYSINRKILHEIAIKAEFKENKKGKFAVIMEDGKEAGFDSGIKEKELKDGAIVHFIGLGYCRYDGKRFWFAHR
jgi:glutamyl-tRNA synthetase